MTAEDLLIKKRILLKIIEEGDTFPLNLTRDTHIGTAIKIKESMIEFAKYHVEKALEKASEQAYVSNAVFCEIDRSSIIDAYPLEKIK
jgi:hypothetical protein